MEPDEDCSQHPRQTRLPLLDSRVWQTSSRQTIKIMLTGILRTLQASLETEILHTDS